MKVLNLNLEPLLLASGIPGAATALVPLLTTTVWMAPKVLD